MSRNSLTSGSISLGTAKSTIKMGLCFLDLRARSTVPLPRIGSCAAVAAMTRSVSGSFIGMLCRSIAEPPSSYASRRAFSSVRLATVMCLIPALTRCRPTSAAVSPAPIIRMLQFERSENNCCANVTEVAATETELSPIAVSVRTFLATLKLVCDR